MNHSSTQRRTSPEDHQFFALYPQAAGAASGGVPPTPFKPQGALSLSIPIVAAILCSAIASPAAQSAPPVPLVHYAFESNVNDSSGNNRHGTIFGADGISPGTLTYGSGILGDAAHFSHNAFIDLPADPVFNLGPGTSKTWRFSIKLDDLHGEQAFVSKRSQVGDSLANGLHFGQVDRGNLYLHFALDNHVHATPQASLMDWSEIILIKDGVTWYAYQEGIPLPAHYDFFFNPPVNDLDPGVQMSIGGARDGANGVPETLLRGWMDEFYVYDGALFDEFGLTRTPLPSGGSNSSCCPDYGPSVWGANLTLAGLALFARRRRA